MGNHQSFAYQAYTPTDQLKESIRDMVRLQRDYQIPDELFWQIFNARALLNEQIDVNGFLNNLNAPVGFLCDQSRRTAKSSFDLV